MREPEFYMHEALILAQEAFDHGEVPVGCVIADSRGRIIGRGRNMREEKHSALSHAECEAIEMACQAAGDWRLDGCSLYVTLEPCPMCAGAMVMSQLSQCVFGAPDPQKGCCGSVYDLPNDPALGGSTQWTAGVLVEECKALLDAFFQKKRAKQP